MRADIYARAARQKKQEQLDRRVQLLESFIAQTTDSRVRNILRFGIKQLQRIDKKPRIRLEIPGYGAAWAKALNDETRKVATSSYRKWSADEDVTVLVASENDSEIGKALGRSHKAVVCRRVRLMKLKQKGLI